MKRPLILHCIDSLSMGGTEILLRNTIDGLTEFDHLVIYLKRAEELKTSFKSDVKFICLDYCGWHSMLRSIWKLRGIIIEKQPVLVHSHLFYATIAARLATSRKTPLITTLHSIFSIDAFQKNKFSLLAEKFTLREWHILVGVSAFVLKDYISHVKFKGKSFVLYNFIKDDFFKRTYNRTDAKYIKCIAVGNLKAAKNYHYLLEIFSFLKGHEIQLDIYGDGEIRNDLQRIIDEKGLNVNLMGKSNQIESILDNYDLFIQASDHEGFGLSVIEAMAKGIPVFLSDIEVFHEITGNYAYFFPLNNSSMAAELLIKLMKETSMGKRFTEKGIQFCLKNYSEKDYFKKLLTIYREAGVKDGLATFSK